MAPPNLRAVTFDFWNTLFVPSPHPMRVRANRLASWLGAGEDDVLRELEAAFAHHTAEWREGRCWGPVEAAQQLAERFLPGASPRCLAELTELVESSGASAGERLVDGVAEAVERLRAAGIRLGIISDTGFSPGRVLRTALDVHGLLGHFVPSALAFSGEVGVPKPDARIFRSALAGLAVPPGESAHVGDLRRTDVRGARTMGMRSVRFNGCYDDCGDGPEAEIVISRMSDLPAALGL